MAIISRMKSSSPPALRQPRHRRRSRHRHPWPDLLRRSRGTGFDLILVGIWKLHLLHLR
ncbi:unnamed protein product [Spirodela intermedia]|uniref:Uncharacterized protein n=1 Tax=Spirodela intermedia TaxID=51605 RepID=A0A7I8KBC0_SPIIN|nr:unnamed protein product [Spirodela intermedia]